MSAPDGRQLMAEDGLLTVREACRWLSVSRAVLYRLLKRGAFAYAKLGRLTRVSRRGLVDYAAGLLRVPKYDIPKPLIW